MSSVNRLCAVVFLALALVGATALHTHKHGELCGLGYDRPTCLVQSPWQNPMAVVLLVTGFAVAGSLEYIHRRGTLRAL